MVFTLSDIIRRTTSSIYGGRISGKNQHSTDVEGEKLGGSGAWEKKKGNSFFKDISDADCEITDLDKEKLVMEY